MSDFSLVYPDVLGAVTGGRRMMTTNLQYAAGIFPPQVYVNQPIELIVLLQNMIREDVTVRVLVRAPNRDRQNNPVNLEFEAGHNVSLTGGEVGLLRIPLRALAPTQASKSLPIRIQVHSSITKEMTQVRPPDGGPPPSAVAVSPFRLQALREVAFPEIADSDSDVQTVNFDIFNKRLPPQRVSIRPQYERLWAAAEAQEEQKLAQSHLAQVQEMAYSIAHGTAYWELLDAVDDRFAARGLPLHPGEAIAIARMMAYTVDEAPTLEAQIKVESLRWFRTLTQVIAHDPQLLKASRGEVLAKYVFDAILFDSIGFGFKILDPIVKEDLGTAQERISFANRVLTWMAGAGEPDLSYIYLPLAMAGLAVHRLVQLDRRENPWTIIDALREAMGGRERLIAAEASIIFEILNDMLRDAELKLIESRVSRD